MEVSEVGSAKTVPLCIDDTTVMDVVSQKHCVQMPHPQSYQTKTFKDTVQEYPGLHPSK
jgi:hypothetical protein